MRSSTSNAKAARKGCATVVAAILIGVTVTAQTIQINGAGATLDQWSASHQPLD